MAYKEFKENAVKVTGDQKKIAIPHVLDPSVTPEVIYQE